MPCILVFHTISIIRPIVRFTTIYAVFRTGWPLLKNIWELFQNPGHLFPTGAHTILCSGKGYVRQRTGIHTYGSPPLSDSVRVCPA